MNDSARAVLFDVDGTLFDHEGAALKGLRAWLPSIGVRADVEVLARWFSAEEEHVALWRSGRISWQEQRRRRLRQVLPGHVPDADDGVDALFAVYLSHYEAAWAAFADVSGVLDELESRRLRLGILTHGASAQQTEKLRAIGVADRFEFVLTAEDLGRGKPDPSAYLAACDRFALQPHQVVHVGDDPELDVDAPAAVGLRSVLLDRTSRHPDRAALRHLSELVPWIDGCGPTTSSTDARH